MMQPKKSMRLKYFIRSGLQQRLLRVNILLVIFVSLVIAYTVYQSSMSILGTSLEEVYPPGLLNGIYKDLIATLVVRLLLVILVTIIVTFLISHRVAGPAYHIERDLATMAEGDLTKRVYLRKSDELKPIAAKLNKMTDMVSQNLNSIEKNLGTMEKLYQELGQDGFDLSRRKELSENIDTALKEVRNAISKFRIK